MSFSLQTQANPELGEEYLNQATQFKENRQLDSSIVYFKKAANIFKTVKDWEQYTQCLREIGISYSKLGAQDTACDYLHQAIQTQLQNLTWQQKELQAVAKNYNYLGYIYVMRNPNVDSARVNFEKSILLLQRNKIQDVNLAYACKELGNVYTKTGQFDKAIHNLNYAWDTYNLIGYHSNKALCRMDIGIWHKTAGSDEKAIQIFQELVQLPNLRADRKAKAAYNLLDLLARQGNIEAAKKHMEEVVTTFEQVGRKDWLAATYSARASIATAENRLEDAKQYFGKGIELLQAAKAQDEPYEERELGRMYTRLANVYAKEKDWGKALLTHQTALKTFLPDFQPNSTTENPSLSLLHDAVKEPRIIEALCAKAQSLYLQYFATQSSEILEKAVQTYELSTQQIDLFKQTISGDNAKTQVNNIILPVYEQGLQTALTLYQSSKDEQYHSQAFLFSEKSKASVLLSAIKDLEERQAANIPDSLYHPFLTYKAKLMAFKLQAQTANDQSNYNDSIFYYSRELEKKEAAIKAAYPNYKDYLLEDTYVNITDIQKRLIKDHKNLVSYIIGDTSIYTFLITPQKTHIYQQVKPPKFDAYIQEIRDFLKLPKYDSSNYQIYTRAAYNLYQILVKPIENHLKGKKLVIIPNGKLAYIPFEALISEMPNYKEGGEAYGLKQMPYLIKDYQMNYAYSATLWMMGLEHKSKPNQPIVNNYIGFGPKFLKSPDSLSTKDCAGEILPPLKWSNSIQDVCEILGGKSYLDKEANKENFEAERSNAKILHLYTHACINDNEPMQNQIFFTDQPLFNYELYHTELNADLAVLTACETGTGKLVEGEGIMSLARAFMYAGCPSVVTSLWKAHEKSSQKITQSFYENLADGQDKDAALQQAKLDFLAEGSSRTTHPHFWATFIQVGNPEQLDLTNSTLLKWWDWGKWVLLFLGFVLFFMIFRKKM